MKDGKLLATGSQADDNHTWQQQSAYMIFARCAAMKSNAEPTRECKKLDLHFYVLIGFKPKIFIKCNRP